MDIRGLGISQISNAMEKYVQEYFKGDKLNHSDNGMFAESYTLYFQELTHLIPTQYHSMYNENDQFSGASGILDLRIETDKEYTVMLLSTVDYSKALFLFLQETDNITNDEKIIMLKDFVCSGIYVPE